MVTSAIPFASLFLFLAERMHLGMSMKIGASAATVFTKWFNPKGCRGDGIGLSSVCRGDSQ